MSKWRKSIWTLGVLAIGAISAVIFGKTVCFKGFEYYVHKIDPEAHVQVEQMGFSTKGLVLHNVCLDGALGHIAIEKLHLGLRVGLRQLSFRPSVKAIKPIWEVPKSLSQSHQEHAGLKLHLQIVDGKLKRGEALLPCAFTSGDTKEDIGLLELLDGAIEVMLKNTDERLTAISRFHHAQLEALKPFGDLFPTSWIPEAGEVAGHLTAEWSPDAGLCEFGGDIEATELELWHPKRQLQFGAKTLKWQGDFPTGTLHIDDGYFLALSKRLPAQWGLRLSGKIEKGKIALAGCMVREGEVFPIAVAGDGKMGKDTSLQTTFHISGEGSSTVAINLKPTQSIIRGIFKNISSKQLLLFRDGLGAFFPIFQDLELEGHHLNAELTTFMKGGKLTLIEADKITAEKMFLKWPSQNIAGEGQNLMLTASLPFDPDPQWKKALWNVAIDRGAIQDFEDVSLRLAVDGEKLQQGRASGKWQGLELEGEATGTLAQPQISLNAWGTTEKLAKIWNVPSVGDEPLTARALIDHKKRDWSLAGHLKTAEGEITFGACFQLKKELPQGWIEGEKVPRALYHIVSKALKVPFDITGDIGLSGTLSPAGFELAVSSPLLKVQSDEVDIELPHLDKHSRLMAPLSQHAMINYRAKTRSWEIAVPLFGAKLYEKSHQLCFDRLEGLALYDGKRLYVQDLKGCICNLQICMHASLEIMGPDQVDLSISATELTGDVKGVLDVLGHFERFKTLDIPITGQVMHLNSHPFSLYAPLGQPEKKAAFSAHLKLQDATYPVTENLQGTALCCELKYSSDDEVLELHALDGDLKLIDDGKTYEYEVNAPDLKLKDIDNGDWEFDLRIESKTHDLMRFCGSLDHVQGIALDADKSHLFGGKLSLKQLKFSPFTFDGQCQLRLPKLATAMRFINALNLYPIDATTIRSIERAELKGCIAAEVTYGTAGLNLDLSGENLKLKQWKIPKFSLKLDREENTLSLDHLIVGDFQARALAEKRADGWNISLFEIDWGKTGLQTFEGGLIDHMCTLRLDRAQIDLEQISPLLFEKANPYFQGLLNVAGNMSLDILTWELMGQFQFDCPDFTAANIALKTEAPFELTYNKRDGLTLIGGVFDLAGNAVELEKLMYNHQQHAWSCNDLALSLAPETIHFLAEKGLIPYLETDQDELLVRGLPVRWDNHLETTVDFCYSPDSFVLSAKLKDGYYWVGDMSCYLKNGCITGRNTGCEFTAQSTLNHADFTISAKLPFDATQDPLIILDDHSELDDKPLKICFSRTSKAIIKHAVGSFCGFDLNFHHNALLPNHTHLGLTGEAKIDWSLAAKILPSEYSEAIQDYDMGRGYKLTGDLLFNVSEPTKSTFNGYFKGKDFELLGYKFKNLLSKIDYSSDYLLLQDFSLTDEALALTIPHVNVAKKSISIPHLKVQDLRPSLLQKCGKLPGRLKPFVIKELDFHKIKGTLGKPKSFSGKGRMHFINTFKRDVTLLDIPKELFSRIGLDTGLLIPVRGELSCELDGSRIHFTKLENTYSDGERSEFFLSKKHPSYIDLDGQIHIDIRMKQYVLLKVTQPFVLSIRGTLDHPKFSLQ